MSVVECIGGTGAAMIMVENGKRRLDLNRVPALAATLGLDVRETCLLVLKERFPLLYEAIFDQDDTQIIETAELPW